MSNADAVRSFYGAVESGDLPAALALLAPDCAWTEMDGLAGGTYRGPDEVRDGVFVKIGGEWEGFAMVLDELVDGGETVVGIGTYRGTFRSTGRALEARVVHAFHVHDGVITAFEQFTDTAAVTRAMVG